MLVLSSMQGARPDSESGPMIMLGSNDYLGLAADPDVKRGAIRALERYGSGLAMNQPFATTKLHESLRETIADFTGTESSLLFSSCTAANIALLTTLGMTRDDVLVSDSNNHASIIDGCRLAKARTLVYASRNVPALKIALAEEHVVGRRTIISDGVFSVEGDIAPAAALAEAAHQTNSILVLDESHAAGVIGERGRGTASTCDIDSRLDVGAFTGTFAKAFGAGGGGYIAGSVALLEEVKRAARFYIFNTGMHIAAVGAALVGVGKARDDAGRREILKRNTAHLRDTLQSNGFELMGGLTPIVPVIVGDEEKAKLYSSRLSERGLVAPVMTFPIVPKGSARLRLQPSASHTSQDIADACSLLIEEASALNLLA